MLYLHAKLLTCNSQVNCRRAAAAAFQENVGRQGNYPHGIDIVNAADYFSLSSRVKSYLHVAVGIAQYEGYLYPFVEELLYNKICHWVCSNAKIVFLLQSFILWEWTLMFIWSTCDSPAPSLSFYLHCWAKLWLFHSILISFPLLVIRRQMGFFLEWKSQVLPKNVDYKIPHLTSISSNASPYSFCVMHDVLSLLMISAHNMIGCMSKLSRSCKIFFQAILCKEYCKTRFLFLSILFLYWVLLIASFFVAHAFCYCKLMC